MDREQLYEICLSQPETTQEYPFGPDLAVFKVAGKVFVIATDNGTLAINVKCDPDVALSLRGTYGSVTAMSVWPKHWNYVKAHTGEISDNELSNWIEDSFDLVVDKLPKTAKLRIQGQVRGQNSNE